MGWFNGRRRDEEVQHLAAQVRELQETLARRALDPPTEPPRIAQADAVDLRFASLDDHLASLEDRLGQIDRRLTTISTELANQLNELSNELNKLGDETMSAAATELAATVGERVAELRDAQVHLANEQTRYQIALREEIATLARRIRP
jgi:chromosome segregation ATPase